MFCTRCGREIREGLKFCPGCGTAVKMVAKTADAQQQVVVTNTYEEKHAKKKGTGTLIALIIVLILIIVALIGVSFAEFWITGGKETIYETLGISVEDEEELWEEFGDKEAERKNKKSKEKEVEEESVEMKEEAEKTEEAEEVEEAEEAEEAEEQIVEEISEYILEDSDSKYLTEDDLEGLSKEECRLARNELYARHGRKFDDESLQEYFNSCSWYRGTIDVSEFSEAMLSDIEIANRDLIVEYEEEMGYR